jgi:peptidase E
MVFRSPVLNLALTSDLPSTANQVVFDFIRSGGPHPRIAWMPPFTEMGRERFPAAQELFGAYGFSDLEYCDIDEEPNEEQLAHLDQYDVIYLTGGDPIGFRRNILRAGLPGRLRQCLTAGRLIVAASGGSMQLTKNVSLFRLLTAALDEVFANRSEYEALGVVDYEILPHLNRFEPAFLETVRRYSERVAHDVIGLADGAAVLHRSGDDYWCVGQATRFRSGVMTPIEAAAQQAAAADGRRGVS